MRAFNFTRINARQDILDVTLICTRHVLQVFRSPLPQICSWRPVTRTNNNLQSTLHLSFSFYVKTDLVITEKKFAQKFPSSPECTSLRKRKKLCFVIFRDQWNCRQSELPHSFDPPRCSQTISFLSLSCFFLVRVYMDQKGETTPGLKRANFYSSHAHARIQGESRTRRSLRTICDNTSAFNSLQVIIWDSLYREINTWDNEKRYQFHVRYFIKSTTFQEASYIRKSLFAVDISRQIVLSLLSCYVSLEADHPPLSSFELSSRKLLFSCKRLHEISRNPNAQFSASIFSSIQSTYVSPSSCSL